MQLSAMFGAPAENILSQDMLLSPELCARLQSLRYGNTGQPIPIAWQLRCL